MSNTNISLDRTTPRKNYAVDGEEYETFEEYVAAIDENTFYEWDRCPQYLISEHEEVVDHYVDFKRGYEETLYVFSEDYAATGRPKPRKKDRKYYGVSITEYNHGETSDWEGFEPYELQSRRITVKEWHPVKKK
jgi:hypothetical protein